MTLTQHTGILVGKSKVELFEASHSSKNSSSLYVVTHREIQDQLFEILVGQAAKRQ
jgi:hypothetical protein